MLKAVENKILPHKRGSSSSILNGGVGLKLLPYIPLPKGGIYNPDFESGRTVVINEKGDIIFLDSMPDDRQGRYQPNNLDL